MMAAVTTVRGLHADVVTSLFGADALGDEDDALRLMGVLTTHRLVLSDKVGLADAPRVSTIEPITHRLAAEAIAAVWRGTDDPRNKYEYWYARWNGNPAYANVFQAFLDKGDQRVQELIEHLRGHSWIARIERDT